MAVEIRANSKTTLPPTLRFFSWILVSLWALFLVVKAVCNKVPALRYLPALPYRQAFLGERFPDFLLLTARFRYFHHAAFFSAYADPTPFMYPAPLGVVYKLFYVMPFPLPMFLGFGIGSLLVAALLFARVLHRRGLSAKTAYLFSLAVLTLSMPVWFVLVQANMETVIWSFVTLGVAFFFARRGYSAAACFGIAASMKLYPIAYLGLFLIRKKYGPIVVGVAVAAASTVSSLWLLGGSIGPTWVAVSKGVGEFRLLFMLQKRRELAFDHSLLSLVKLGWKHFPGITQFAPVLTAYLAIVAILGTAIFFLRVWRMPIINQVMYLAIACVLLPPVSFEYTLLHMFVPLALLMLVAVEAAQRSENIPGLRPAIVCLAVLLAPLSEVIFMGHGLDGQIKAVTLAVLFVIVIGRPFHAPGIEEFA